jgi:hypothetical protein
MPVEITRIVYLGCSIVPLLLFSGGEYILSGEEKYTKLWANTIENGGKKQVEDLAKKIDIKWKIY